MNGIIFANSNDNSIQTSYIKGLVLLLLLHYNTPYSAYIIELDFSAAK